VPCLIDVHLDRKELEMPILREIPTENNDDPAIVDLDKLKGGPLWALVHLIDAIWDVGDEIHLMFTALVNGSPVASHEATLPITQVPGQFAWDIPNDKVIADSIVRVSYELRRAGKVIGASKAAKAQVIGQSAPDVEVTFTNAPFAVAPKGRVKDIKLRLMQAGQPISGTITVTLPQGTVFADGSGGTRDFNTQSDGTLTISGVIGAATPGTFSVTASSGRDTETAIFTVTEHGPVGPIPLGGTPTGVALSPDGTRAFVTGAHRISEVDTARSHAVRTFDDRRLDVSWEAFLGHDGSHVYACNGNNALSVFDTNSATLIASIAVSGHPIAIRLSKDGSVAYVSTWNTNSLAVIDLKNLQVIKMIPVGSYPRGIALSGDYRDLYVCNNGGDSVSVINTLTLTVSKTIPLGMNCYGCACSLDGNHLYICGQTPSGQGIVKQINVHSGAEVRVIPVIGFPRGIVLNHAGTKGYCCDRDTNTVSEIDISSGMVIGTQIVASGPLMIAISPDDKIGYVTCVYGNVLYSILLDGAGGMGTSNIAGLGAANVASTTLRTVSDTPD
jgi:YVTN family beta-propeller protein